MNLSSKAIAHSEIDGNDSVVITFTGHDFRWFRDGLGPRPAFRGVLSALDEKFDSVFIFDPCQTWYLRDPDNLSWDGYRYYHQLIANIAKHYKKVLLLGVSMGGFPPLLHADLGTSIVSISPQVDLSLEVAQGHELYSLRQSHAAMIPEYIRVKSLKLLVSAVSRSKAHIEVHLGTNSVDQEHVKYLPSNIRIVEYPTSQHAIGRRMRDTGKLSILIEEALKRGGGNNDI